MTRTDDKNHLLTRKNVLKRLMVNHEISIFGTTLSTVDRCHLVEIRDHKNGKFPL